MIELMRSAVLTPFPALARSLEQSPDALISAAGTDRTALGIPDMFVPVGRVAELPGFSGGNAFSRWFLGAFAKRLSEWRKTTGAASDT